MSRRIPFVFIAWEQKWAWLGMRADDSGLARSQRCSESTIGTDLG